VTEIHLDMAGFAATQRALQRFPHEFELEAGKELAKVLRRGLPALRASVPFVSGRLAESFMIRRRRSVIRIINTAFYAGFVRFRSPPHTFEERVYAWLLVLRPEFGQAALTAARNVLGRHGVSP